MSTVRRATGRWVSTVYTLLYKKGVLNNDIKYPEVQEIIEEAFDTTAVPASKMSGCCGMVELYNWYHSQSKGSEALENAVQEKLRVLDQLIKSYSKGRSGKCIQLVLTTSQLNKYPKYKEEFEKRGFRLVSRFCNTTGTICNVFHLTTGESDRMPKEKEKASA